MDQTRLHFVYFRSFRDAKTNLTINLKSVDGVLGIRNRGTRMVDTDESIELWERLAKNLLWNRFISQYSILYYF